ncbi:MAG: LytTR family DNA-binding domain-containing protein, partial [Tannerellaceae bacterium]|nr:LytTR family DNA-binding domain-containing protein [Tannerellaceae bacterium]
MKCIIVDDEPLAREAMEILVKETPELELTGTFHSAMAAAEYIKGHEVQLIFTDIQMPQMTGLEFVRMLPASILFIFTTAYSEYAIESYEINAIDYLVKPIELSRFQKAVRKALSYYALLSREEKEDIETFRDDYIFVRSERRYQKVYLKEILFIEGLKDYVILQCEEQRLITLMNLKTISEHLPATSFLRINKSYIVNMDHISAFDMNDIQIRTY